MQQSIFFQLSLVLGLATIVAVVVRLFRQPLIIGYLVTGFVAGPSLLGIVHHREAFESFSQIGLTLLLFIVGLGLNVKVVRNAGRPVVVTCAAILAILGSLGYGVGRLLGYGATGGVIVAVALLFSSTIIVVKSLSDKKEQSRLYGQIAIGILLVEDVLATITLIAISAQGNAAARDGVGVLLAKGVAIASSLILLGAHVAPRTTRFFARSQELLSVSALAWAFGVASLCWWAGFSLEVGALFAGVSLAHLPYAQEISTRLKPLRDFFIVLFFITLGEQLQMRDVSSALWPAVLLSLVILVVKPLIVVASLGMLGYTKQTSFKAAVHLSQISEFSIVVVVLAGTNGIVRGQLATIITLVAMLTIAVSTYLMKYDDELYRLLAKPLSFFERSDTKQDMKALEHYPLVLLGYHAGGHQFINTFRKMKKRYVVIDYSPDVIEHLERQHISHIYGDATDYELLDEIGLQKSELIISTMTDATTNRLVAEHILSRNPSAIFIAHATTFDDAEKLYELGATYVIMPHFIGNEQINEFIRQHGNDKHAFNVYRAHHLQAIGEAVTV